jgi:hypothetical protein
MVAQRKEINSASSGKANKIVSVRSLVHFSFGEGPGMRSLVIKNPALLAQNGMYKNFNE